MRQSASRGQSDELRHFAGLALAIQIIHHPFLASCFEQIAKPDVLGGQSHVSMFVAQEYIVGGSNTSEMRYIIQT